MNQRADHSRRPCYSQNKEHRKICNDCTVQINPDATTLWRVIGFAVPDLMTGPVDLFVSESGKSFMLPKKVKASSQNNLIPFTGCCMREGYWISASVSSAFSCCYHAVSTLFLFLFMLSPSHILPNIITAFFSSPFHCSQSPFFLQVLCSLLWPLLSHWDTKSLKMT